MTAFHDLLDTLRDNTRRIFAEARPSGAAIPNLVTVFSPDMPAGLKLIPFMVFGDTDRTIEVIYMAIAGTAATAVVTVADTWHALVPDNPDTGQPWGRDEMHEYVAAHGRDEVITEAALVTGRTRDGDSGAYCMPYEIKSDGFWWREPIELGRADDGRVPDAMERAFAAPTFASLHPGQPRALCALSAVKGIADYEDIELAEVFYEELQEW